MTTQEIADRLVALCSQGQLHEAIVELYSPDVVSVEAGAPPGMDRTSKGIEAVLAKGEWWVTNHDVHSTTVEGPLVAGNHFSVVFKFDFTVKATGQRVKMEEIAVYKVDGGKIVYEEFFYSM